jgi:hypothetical protein
MMGHRRGGAFYGGVAGGGGRPRGIDAGGRCVRGR